MKMTIQNLMINHGNWLFSKLWFLCKLLLTRHWWKKSRKEDEVALQVTCADSHPWNCTAVGYVGHNALTWFHLTVSAKAQDGFLPGLMWPRGKFKSEPRSVGPSARHSFHLTGPSVCWDISLWWCLRCAPRGPHSAASSCGVPCLAGSWTVCALFSYRWITRWCTRNFFCARSQ